VSLWMDNGHGQGGFQEKTTLVKKMGLGRVKTHYNVHKMLSQVLFCKILKFVIGHVIN
jgi:hypothetical protein